MDGPLWAATASEKTRLRGWLAGHGFRPCLLLSSDFLRNFSEITAKICRFVSTRAGKRLESRCLWASMSIARQLMRFEDAPEPDRPRRSSQQHLGERRPESPTPQTASSPLAAHVQSSAQTEVASSEAGRVSVEWAPQKILPEKRYSSLRTTRRDTTSHPHLPTKSAMAEGLPAAVVSTHLASCARR